MFFRKAVRDRFEATRCWQYEYDCLNPPPETSEHRSGTSIYDPNCDIMTSECSTPYGSAPVSLTEEEDREFWSLMRSAPADIPSLKSIKRASRLGDNISLSSGGYSSSHDELFNSPREVCNVFFSASFASATRSSNSVDDRQHFKFVSQERIK